MIKKKKHINIILNVFCNLPQVQHGGCQFDFVDTVRTVICTLLLCGQLEGGRTTGGLWDWIHYTNNFWLISLYVEVVQGTMNYGIIHIDHRSLGTIARAEFLAVESDQQVIHIMVTFLHF